MSLERWGAFSVIDHKNARALAVEVLLYDRLILPYPPEWDRPRWVEQGWDPDGLDERLRVLGDIAIKANWDLARQKYWRTLFDQAKGEAQNDEIALMSTARVLASQEHRPQLDNVTPLSVVAAYQSERDAEDLHPGLIDLNSREEFDFLIGQRIEVPDDENPKDALNRAIELASGDSFRETRAELYNWHDGVSSRGASPEAAVREMARLVQKYNQHISAKAKRTRREVVFLVGSISLTAAGVVAGIAPAAFDALGIGTLSGSSVMQIGSLATGAVLQIADYAIGKLADDKGPGEAAPAAVFHQIEQDLGWRWREQDR